MSDIRTDWQEAPSPVDISIYQASDQPLLIYPYGTDIADLPANWEANYSYRLDIFDAGNAASPLATFTGTNDGATGLTTIDIPKATRMGWTWDGSKKYDLSEIVAGEVITAPVAGNFVLLLRGNV